MTPLELIGKPYRLGADFSRHGEGDCLSLARTVLAYYGIKSPTPQRDWYRRLRRGDMSIFSEQLHSWGVITTAPRIGVVALCQANERQGLAVFAEEGWLAFAESEVVWSPIGGLQVVACFCPQKQSCVIHSD